MGVMECYGRLMGSIVVVTFAVVLVLIPRGAPSSSQVAQRVEGPASSISRATIIVVVNLRRVDLSEGGLCTGMVLWSWPFAQLVRGVMRLVRLIVMVFVRGCGDEAHGASLAP